MLYLSMLCDTGYKVQEKLMRSCLNPSYHYYKIVQGVIAIIFDTFLMSKVHTGWLFISIHIVVCYFIGNK